MASDGGEELSSLRAEVAKLKEENELLVRDLENMCMANSGTVFNSSFVVSERIYSLEAELKAARSKLAAVTGERDGLREDLAAMRHARADVDTEWKAQAARNKALESELDFYQRQSVAALAERDEALVDADEARRSTIALEKASREAGARSDEEARRRADADAALAAARKELTGLRARVGELEALEAVKGELGAARTELAAAHRRSEELAAAHEGLKAELATAAEALAAKTRAAEDAAAKLADEAAAREALAASSAEEAGRLRTLLAAAEAAADEANAGREEYEDSLYAARAEVELSRKAAGEAVAARKEAEEARAAAAAKLAAQVAQHGAEFDGLGALQEACTDLKMRLAQATQQKVEVMMQLADLRETNQQLRDQLPPPGSMGRRK